MALPPPTGPFLVGSATYRITDATRPSHLASAVPGRSLFLKLWYPAQSPRAGAPELLWEQLQDVHRAPALIRCALRLLQRRSASYPDAPLAPDLAETSTVVYNHGLVSFASENTSLMQELASRGHVVIAIEHQEQLPEYQTLMREQPRAEKQRARELTAKIRRGRPAERSALARELYDLSVNTVRIVLERARDTRYVLDNMGSTLEAIPACAACAGAAHPVHLVGYSLGGAVATYVAAKDNRVVSATNIDGGLYATANAIELRVPHLMLYSAVNEGMNDDLLPRHATRLAAPNTTHLNFHDIGGLLPALRWIHALGRTDPNAVLDWRNRVVADFIERPHAASLLPTAPNRTSPIH